MNKKVKQVNYKALLFGALIGGILDLYLYNINLSIQDFYNNPSIEGISKLICEHTNKSDVPDSSSSKHIVKISDIQKPLYSELSDKKDGTKMATQKDIDNFMS